MQGIDSLEDIVLMTILEKMRDLFFPLLLGVQFKIGELTFGL